MSRGALVLSFFLTLPAAADCIDQGHYAIVADAGSLRGTPWPYAEDLSSRSDQMPVPDGITIAYDESLPWTKIQTGCATYGERNVYASEDVNLVLRASFAFSYASHATAVTGTRYEVELRLDDAVVLREMRRLDGRYPQSQRFGTVVSNVARGAHVYSMWLRLLDGPETNQVTIGLQWITAQGMPSRYPVASGRAEGTQHVGRKWRAIGPSVRIETTETSDLLLLSSTGTGERLAIRYSIGKGDPTIARSAAFDQRLHLPPGRYAIRLWARALDGDAEVENVTTHVAAFPSANVPMIEASARNAMEVTPIGSTDEPVTLDAVCGRWTKLLDFQTPPAQGDFSWFLHSYIELPRVVGHGYVEIAVQAVNNVPSRRLGIIEMTDMGIAVAQLSPGGDAVSFYGDASSWGNDGGNAMSLWIRIIEGCNEAAFGNELTVGKRRVAIKLLPTTSIHLP